MDDMQIVEFNNEQDCYEGIPEVGEHEFAEVMQNVGGDEFCRIVESQFAPFVGQEFNDLEEAVKFYKMYALACGFDFQLHCTTVSNFEFSLDYKFRVAQISARVTLSANWSYIVQCSSYPMLKIGATRTYKMYNEHVNGFENIGASLNDFKNFHRDVKCYINEWDGQLFIDHFKNMAETHENFFFDYEVDVDGTLIRAVWADDIARRNYSVFGDDVSFDPTYSTNKYDMVFTPFTSIDNHKRSINFCGALLFRENEDYFDWVFKRFLVAMGGKEPEYIITAQDPGIIKSVKNVFKTARHRFCMWHIMNKVPVKYGGTTKDYPKFIKLNAIVWDDELEPDEFDGRWGEIMKEHNVGKSAWFEEVYLKRRQWVMAHCRDLNMGSVMRTTQRSESENSFFKSSRTTMERWLNSGCFLKVQLTNKDILRRKLIMTTGIRHRKW
ncbi:protein FAR1-RELATED SEQUENCE 5-like [Silene latifolia]|uniref:protein FAR1-RELATED SEQUENCE 5-like n=1 Tax=Silene latifolia TaxID=37657 RepID=UPI003D78A686